MWSNRFRKVHAIAETRASELCAKRGGECEGERDGMCAGGVRGEGVESV